MLPQTRTITDEDVRFFQDNGYLIVEGALSPEEVNELRQETTAICRGDRGDIRGMTPADPSDSEADILRRYLCIHFPHKMSDVMFKYIAHPVIVDVLTKVISPNVKSMQSMLFIKAAGKPGQAWHQDEIYIPTRDRSLTGGWIAMDDATVENGCLWVIPGSHKHGILWQQHHHDDRRFDCSEETMGFPYTDEDAVPVEVKAGAIVFFNGYLLHRSLPNYPKTGYRRVLVNHYMSAESLLPWHNPRQGERMATADMRDIVLIAGRDPYGFKGTESVAQPHIRPDGQGGCGDPKQNVKIESRENSALPYDDDADDEE